MNAPLIEPTVKAWSAQVFAPHPPVVALTGLPAKPTYTIDNKLSKGKATRNEFLHGLHTETHLAPSYRRPEPYAEDDCAHWFQEERWIEQPCIDPPVGDTEWCALLPLFQPHGEAWYMAWGTDDAPRFCDRPGAPAKARFDTAPLVAAREKKEAALLVKIAPENDCLRVVSAPVADPPRSPKPVAALPLVHADGKTPLGCSRYGVLPTITPCPDDLTVTLWREDGFGHGRLA